ncbi:MAG: hypothetical protein K0S55_1568 [Clostridia bacterium]|jgi:hypothetical protein|nr:hypothetical protein [Clostridia bacterium]
MGYKLLETEVRLSPNEEKDLCLELTHENRAAIHGVVRFPDKRPVKDAVVKLFAKKECCDLIPITFTFTDKCGQFLFGVESCVDYVIKVFYYQPECIKPKPPCVKSEM